MAVRNESVRLSLDDAFTSGMARAAAATAVLSKELHGLDGTNVNLSKGLSDTDKAIRDVDVSTRNGRASIDQYSGRLGLLADAAIVLGPALLPLGASTIPLLTGALAGLGSAAGGIGVAVLALHGLGDGIKAMNAYDLDPTVQNLQKLRDVEQQLGPAGTQFLKYIDAIEPQLKVLQNTARAGLFPGVEAGINDLLGRLPVVRRIIFDLSQGLGELAREAGHALGGKEFAPFFSYLKTDAEPTLLAFGRATGNVALGLSNLLVAFAPLSRGFTSGLDEMAQSFADWSQHLDTNQSFQHFVDYVQESGPKAIDLIGALVKAFASFAEAAGPVGQDVLPALTAVVKVLGALADSPFGPAMIAGVVAMRAYVRIAALAEAATVSLSRSIDGVGSNMNTMAGKTRFAVTALIGLEVAGQIIQSVGDKAAGAAPDVEKLTAALIAADQERVSSLLNGDLQTALASLDPSGVNGLATSLNNLADKGGAAGKALEYGLGGFVGLTPYMNAATIQSDKATKSFQSLDSSLVEIATTGGPKRAQAAFDALAAAQGLSVAQQKTLMGQLPGFASALGRAANEAALTGEKLDKAANAAASFRAQVDQLNTVLAARASYRDYQASIDDFTKSLKDNGKTLDVTTEKGRANAAALDNIAGTAAKVAQTLKGDARAKFLDNALTAFEKAGTAAGLTEGKIRNLAERIHLTGATPMEIRADISQAEDRIGHIGGLFRKLVGTKVQPKITADDGAAKHTISGIDGLMQALGKKKVSPKISVDPGNSFAVLGGISAQLAHLASKTITVTVKHATVGAFADGGYTGPGPRLEPRGVVHAGEVVLPQHLVNRDWAMLKARYGFLPGFADGGLVQNTYARTAPTGGGSSDAIFQLGHFTDAFSGSLKEAKRKLDEVNKAYDKQKSALDALRSTMADLASTVSSRFAIDLSNSGSTQGASVADLQAQGLDSATAYAVAQASTSTTSPLSTIAGLTAQATQMSGIIKTLKGWGLSGPALGQILSQMSLADLQALVAAGPGEAHAYQSALNGLYGAQASVGHVAAQAAYGAQESAQAKATHALHQQVVAMTHEIKVLQDEQKKTTQAAGQTGPDRTAQGVVTALNGVATRSHK